METRKEEKLISIIVPVYRVEAYLAGCIDSLLAQTLTNTEILLVDDGSPDACPAICDAYAARDRRIRVIHKANGGLSDARNAGLAAACGERIAFVDSDDRVHPCYLQYLSEAMEASGADVVECGFLRTQDPQRTMETLPAPAAEVYTPEEALGELIREGIFRQVVWNKLYTREVLEGILFEKGKYHEDEFFTYQVFGRAAKLARIQADLYDYLQRPDSIMKSGFSLKNLDGMEGKARRQDYLRAHYPSLEAAGASDMASWLVLYGERILHYLPKEEQKEGFRILNSYRRNYFRSLRTRFTGGRRRQLQAHLAILWLKPVCRFKLWRKTRK